MMANLSVNDFEEELKKYLENEEWAKAYKICLEILRVNPENIKFIKYKNQIEDEVKKINIKAIKLELKKIEPLLIAKKYEEYLTALHPLQSYYGDYPELAQIVVNAKKLYEEEVENKQKQFITEQISKIQNVFNHGDYEIALASAEYLVTNNKSVKEISKFYEELKNSLIDIKLNSNQQLLNSAKYEDIIIFLTKLKRLNPKSKKVDKLIEKTKKIYQKYRLENRKDYIYKTIEEIKTLYLKRKYDNAKELLERIIEIDPNNPAIKQLNKKCVQKIIKNMNKTIREQILNNYEHYKIDKILNKESYIKI
jgi:tetratricopeptide (TPR) repeat protein